MKIEVIIIETLKASEIKTRMAWAKATPKTANVIGRINTAASPWVPWSTISW